MQTPARLCSHDAQGGGDTVVARALPGRPGQVVIDKIMGDRGRLTLDPTKNCIGIAAAETLRLLGPTSCGVALTLQKVRLGEEGAAVHPPSSSSHALPSPARAPATHLQHRTPRNRACPWGPAWAPRPPAQPPRRGR